LIIKQGNTFVHFFADWEEEIITLLPSHQGLVRTRRNVASFTTSIDSQDIETQLHAFKELFHLNFTLDSSYISPYLIVQKGNSSWINTLYSNKTSDFNEKTCIFTGYVNNNPKFIGSANLCEPDGMVILASIFSLFKTMFNTSFYVLGIFYSSHIL